MKQNKTLNLRNMVLIAMLSAVAFVLMFLEIPLPFIAPAFYELDFSEVPVLIGTFSMGPVAGIVIELLKNLLHILIKGTSTAYVGELANFLVGCALVVPAGLIYQKAKSKKHALAGMSVGTVLMVAAGSLVNAYILLPWYANHFFACLLYTSISTSRKQFLIRVKGDASRKSELVEKFGSGQLIDAGVAGEIGYLTPVISEKEFDEAAAGMEGILHRIRVQA